MRPSELLRPGDIVAGRYMIRGIAGRGGMSVVYMADDNKLPGKQWAVKETTWLGAAPQALAEEAKLLSRLDHPFLPNVADFVGPDANGRCYTVMEFVRGETLQRRVEQGTADDALLVRLAKELCEALGYLHGLRPRPVIYRDLKPSNIMIDESGHIRLIDFGIARHFREQETADTVPLGTVGFAAPEQFQNRQSDERTDLYTLGAVLYFAFTGGNPFSPAGQPLRICRPDLPERLPVIVEKLLQAEPERRFGTADEVRRALEGVHISDGESPAPAGLDAGAGTKKLIVVGALYSGAGSTFTAVALARTFGRMGLANALIEHPGGQPDLFTLLDGDDRAPGGYRFGEANDSGKDPSISRWETERTEWHPLHPNDGVPEWSAERLYKLLYRIDRPVTIVEVGDRWEDPVVAELCARADERIVVADPYPARWNRPESGSRLRMILRLHEGGRRVRFVANRDTGFPGRGEWLAAFPVAPECYIPELPAALLLAAEWRGKLAADCEQVQERLDAALKPVATAIAPYASFAGKSGKLFGWRRNRR